jgi:hypothetical protein
MRPDTQGATTGRRRGTGWALSVLLAPVLPLLLAWGELPDSDGVMFRVYKAGENLTVHYLSERISVAQMTRMLTKVAAVNPRVRVSVEFFFTDVTIDDVMGIAQAIESSGATNHAFWVRARSTNAVAKVTVSGWKRAIMPEHLR